ncbi:MAG: DMT family transporter [Notoacmeibacter sp.]|nr:DMT family transporter [Notoacmeibacter sp.]
MSADANHAKGLLITAFGGLVLTFDIPLIRLAGGDTWSILMVRSGCTFATVMAVWLVARMLRKPLPALVPGRAGLAVGALYAVSALLFMVAVFNTTTANLVFILALNPMIAALFSWVFLSERPRAVTLAAMAIMLGGVLLIIDEGISAGNWLGDLLALGTATCIAGAITISRRSGSDMGFTPLVAAAVPMVIAAFMTASNGYRIEAPWWIILNGTVLIPVSFFCLANGPKWIPGPEVAMFYLLETVLAPVWVWMIFAEVPSNQSLAGGVILIATLTVHSLWQMHAGRRRRAALTARHPV